MCIRDSAITYTNSPFWQVHSNQISVLKDRQVTKEIWTKPRDIGCGFFSLCRTQTISSSWWDREGAELDKTGSTEQDKDNVSPTLQDVDCIGKLDDAKEPEPHMELLTSDADDHNLERFGRQTVESTAQGLPERGSILVQGSKLRRLHSMPKSGKGIL